MRHGRFLTSADRRRLWDLPPACYTSNRHTYREPVRERDGIRGQWIPAGVINAFGRIVFHTPIDDKDGADFVAGAGSLITQFGFGVVDNDAEPGRVKNRGHDHAGGFTGTRRRTA